MVCKKTAASKNECDTLCDTLVHTQCDTSSGAPSPTLFRAASRRCLSLSVIR